MKLSYAVTLISLVSCAIPDPGDLHIEKCMNKCGDENQICLDAGDACFNDLEICFDDASACSNACDGCVETGACVEEDDCDRGCVNQANQCTDLIRPCIDQKEACLTTVQDCWTGCVGEAEDVLKN